MAVDGGDSDIVRTMMKNHLGMKHLPLILGIVLGLAPMSLAQEEASESLITATPHFAFYSDFESNLHDALLEAGRDQRFSRQGLFEKSEKPEAAEAATVGDGEEVACFAELPPSLQAAWRHAVAYYAEIIASEKWDQKQQYWIRMDLSDTEELPENRDMRFVEIARSIRAAAAPAYRSCYWAARDAENRNWTAELVAQLTVHEEAIAQKLARLYEIPLGGLPIRVDVMETVNWSGATTILAEPAGGHIQISTPDRGPVALELVFHEASHTLMGRQHPIQKALGAAAKKLDLPLPRDLWHAVLFYTTGDAVRRVLEDAGEDDYNPMTFALGIFGHHHEAMKRGWAPYLDGQRSLAEGTGDLIRAVAEVAAEKGEDE